MLQPLDLLKNSLPAPEHLRLDGAAEGEGSVVVRVRRNVPPQCPSCHRSRFSYHSADRNGRFEIGHGKVNPSGLVFWFGGFVAAMATANGKFSPSGCREYWLPEPEKPHVSPKFSATLWVEIPAPGY